MNSQKSLRNYSVVHVPLSKIGGGGGVRGNEVGVSYGWHCLQFFFCPQYTEKSGMILRSKTQLKIIDIRL